MWFYEQDILRLLVLPVTNAELRSAECYPEASDFTQAFIMIAIYVIPSFERARRKLSRPFSHEFVR